MGKEAAPVMNVAQPAPLARPIVSGEVSRGKAYPTSVERLSRQEVKNILLLQHYKEIAPLQGDFPLHQPIEIRNEQRLRTAIHEVAHGLLVYNMNGLVTNMTVVPGNGYLGLTEFTGLTDPQVQVAAMGSSVLSGEGTGGDLALARHIEHFRGSTVAGALESAQHQLNGFSSFFVDRVARMVAHQESVDGKMFAQIVARAAIDEFLASRMSPEQVQLYMQRSQEHMLRAEMTPQERGDKWRIIDTNDTTRIIKVEDNTKRCQQCGVPVELEGHVCVPTKGKENTSEETNHHALSSHPTRRGRKLVD